MATSKSLQKPKILGIVGSTLRIQHPDLYDYTKTFLASTIASSGTAMSVYDNNNIENNDWLIIGEPQDSKTEEISVAGAVTHGQLLTVANTLKFDHELDAKVTKIFERGIKIYGAVTDGGSGTLIASVDSITTPIADAVSITWNRPYTDWTLITTDTPYNYYFVKFTDGTTDSEASDYVLATGLTASSVEKIIQKSLNLCINKR